MYWLKRLYPNLLDMVEASLGKRFKKRPRLIICPGGRPRCESLIVPGSSGVVIGVKKAKILIPKSVAVKSKSLAMLAVAHEATEILYHQHGVAPGLTHTLATLTEGCHGVLLGIPQSADHLWRQHYG